MSAFTEAFSRNLGELERTFSPGLASCCHECNPAELTDDEYTAETEDAGDEGHFSWHGCETCGSRLGGDRFAAHAIDADGAVLHFSICVDCLMYSANGDEPEVWGK